MAEPWELYGAQPGTPAPTQAAPQQGLAPTTPQPQVAPQGQDQYHDEEGNVRDPWANWSDFAKTSWGDKARYLGDAVVGTGKEGLRRAVALGNTVQKYDPVANAVNWGASKLGAPIMPTDEQQQSVNQYLSPTNPGQQTGAKAEHALEYMVPNPVGEGRLVKIGADMAKNALTSYSQDQDTGNAAINAGLTGVFGGLGTYGGQALKATGNALQRGHGAVMSEATKVLTELLGKQGSEGAMQELAASPDTSSVWKAIRGETPEWETAGHIIDAVKRAHQAVSDNFVRGFEQLTGYPTRDLGDSLSAIKNKALNTLIHEYGVNPLVDQEANRAAGVPALHLSNVSTAEPYRQFKQATEPASVNAISEAWNWLLNRGGPRGAETGPMPQYERPGVPVSKPWGYQEGTSTPYSAWDSTVRGIDALKSQLQTMYQKYVPRANFGGETPDVPAGATFALKAAKHAQDVLESNVPGYADLMKKYGDDRDFLAAFAHEFGAARDATMNGQGSQVMQKMAKVFSDKKNNMANLLRELPPGPNGEPGGEEILKQLAGQALKNSAPFGVKVSAPFAGAMALRSPGTTLPLMAASTARGAAHMIEGARKLEPIGAPVARFGSRLEATGSPLARRIIGGLTSQAMQDAPQIQMPVPEGLTGQP